MNTPLGQAYLIPRKKKDRNGQFISYECNFQMGYQGLLDLCYRYGKYKMITAEVVYEGDYFDYRYGTKQFLDHRPEGKPSANPTYVWALYELENGGERFVVWTWNEAMSHGEEFSDSFNKAKPWASPWLSNETSKEEMAKKSVLKSLLKYAPKSVEGQIESALYADGHAVIAEKFEEGGNMRLSLDVKQIEAPDSEMQDFMNQVNSKGRRSEEAEAEMVPTGKKNGEKNTAQATVSVPNPENSGTQRTVSQGNNGIPARRADGSLFPADEAADLEGGVEPPNFQ